MSKKKRIRQSRVKPQTWESTGGWCSPNGKKNPDTYIMLWESQIRSEAFEKLTPRQIYLYLICKAQTKGKHHPWQDLHPDEAQEIEEAAGIPPRSVYHDRVFYLSWDIARQYPHYKSVKNRQVFHRDMKQLHRIGFIEILRRGKNHRTKTIYRLSDEWRKWDG